MRSRRFIAVSAMALVAAPSLAQQPAAAGVAEAAPADAPADAFGWIDGLWRGPATTLTPEGRIRLTQTERSGTMLGGRIRLVEGKGYQPDGSVGFNALGVIARTAAGGYELRSWTLESAGAFPMEVDGTTYVWEVPIAAGTVRYEGSFDGKTWRETGHLVREGQPPVETFRMALRRVDATDWPAGGTLAPR